MEEFKPVSYKAEQKVSDFVPEGVFSGELTDSQKAAIQHSINLGRELQKEIPAIADDFRAGLILDQIARKYDLHAKLGGSFSTVRNVILACAKGIQRGNALCRYSSVCWLNTEGGV